LDAGGRIADLVNCYEWISFNVGPTLMHWLAREAPELLERIQEADRLSLARWGHGNAMAQIFHHIIMPLASQRDKEVEIAWALDDFAARFKRDPEGMWFSECAVDLPTLDAAAARGIKFVVLSPHQVSAASAGQGGECLPVDGHSLDVGRPYWIELPSGRKMAAFFYQADLAQNVAFEGLLSDGEKFWQKLSQAAAALPGENALLTLATDGETYGHHFTFGEMALAYVLAQGYAGRGHLEITNFGAYLAANPPEAEAILHSPSSWSCAHGVERWRSDCGCSTGGHAGWNQNWRAPLRRALDKLKETVDGHYLSRGAALFKNPQNALLRYGQVLADPASAPLFLRQELREEMENGNPAGGGAPGTSGAIIMPGALPPAPPPKGPAPLETLPCFSSRMAAEEPAGRGGVPEMGMFVHTPPYPYGGSGGPSAPQAGCGAGSPDCLAKYEAALSTTGGGPDYPAERAALAWRLLRMQENALAAYTSCAWFFDDISRIEPVNAMRFALRAMELMRASGGPDMQAVLEETLAQAHSNKAEEGDGRDVFRCRALPGRQDPAGMCLFGYLHAWAEGRLPEAGGVVCLRWPGLTLRLTCLEYAPGLVSGRADLAAPEGGAGESYVWRGALPLPGEEVPVDFMRARLEAWAAAEGGAGEPASGRAYGRCGADLPRHLADYLGTLLLNRVLRAGRADALRAARLLLAQCRTPEEGQSAQTAEPQWSLIAPYIPLAVYGMTLPEETLTQARVIAQRHLAGRPAAGLACELLEEAVLSDLRAGSRKDEDMRAALRQVKMVFEHMDWWKIQNALWAEGRVRPDYPCAAEEMGFVPVKAF
jgi:hypothetical protein